MNKAQVEKKEEVTQVCPMAIVKRAEGQTYNEFSELRAEKNRIIRHFCKGILFHDSETGTYDIGSNKMKAERKINHEINRKRMKASRKV